MHACQNVAVVHGSIPAGPTGPGARRVHGARRSRPRVGVLLCGALIVALLTGCGAGSAPEKIGPRGIDELTIPTPSPRPRDFAKHPSSPWLPKQTGSVENTAGVQLTQRVLPEEELGGVVVVPVDLTAVDLSASEVGRLRRWYAVDKAGNVWVFGELATGVFGSRDWQVGVPADVAAEPGLLLPALPRRGDGYLREQVPQGPRDQVTTIRVAKTDPDFRAECGPCVEVEVTTAEGRIQREIYREGDGLISLEPVSGWPLTD